MYARKPSGRIAAAIGLLPRFEIGVEAWCGVVILPAELIETLLVPVTSAARLTLPAVPVVEPLPPTPPLMVIELAVTAFEIVRSPAFPPAPVDAPKPPEPPFAP